MGFPKTEPRPRLDICECGDYRRDHDQGWRGCMVCVPNDGMNGRECLQFRLFERAYVTWHPK